MTQLKLGIIGGGVMAEAILSRLLNVGLYQSTEVILSDPLDKRRDYLQERYQVQVTGENETISLGSRCSPFGNKTASFASTCTSQTCKPVLVLSILAGVPLATLSQVFPSRAIIRAMPNTAATVGAAMTAITAGTGVQKPQLELAKSIFATIGEVVEIPEESMDAVTGLSGSGPAYVAIFIESLADGGVAAGLPRVQ